MSFIALGYAQELELEPRDKFLLMALAYKADDNGITFPSQGDLAKWTCYNRSTINRALSSLEEAGIVDSEPVYRDDGGQSVKVYRIAALPLPASSKRLRKEMADRARPNVMKAYDELLRRAKDPLLQGSTGAVAEKHTPCAPDAQPPVAPVNSKIEQEEYTREHKEESSSPTPSNPEPVESPEVEAETPQADTGKAEPHWRQLPVLVEKALQTFHSLHSKANAAMLDAWRKEIRKDVIEYGDAAALEALNAAIMDFPTLTNPFRYYRACVKQYRTQAEVRAPVAPPVDSGVDELIRKAKEGIL